MDSKILYNKFKYVFKIIVVGVKLKSVRRNYPLVIAVFFSKKLKCVEFSTSQLIKLIKKNPVDWLISSQDGFVDVT